MWPVNNRERLKLNTGAGKKGGTGQGHRSVYKMARVGSRQRRISRLVHSKGSSLKAAETVLAYRRHAFFFVFVRRAGWGKRKTE